MPIDAESRRELVKRQVKERKTEHNASKSDKDRLAARRKADFYEEVRKRLTGAQTTDSNNE